MRQPRMASAFPSSSFLAVRTTPGVLSISGIKSRAKLQQGSRRDTHYEIVEIPLKIQKVAQQRAGIIVNSQFQSSQEIVNQAFGKVRSDSSWEL